MSLRDAAWRHGKVVGKAAWGWLKEQPPVKRRIAEAEAGIARHRSRIEEKMRRLEAELHEWVRMIEESQGFSPARSGPSLSESYARLGVPYGAPFSEVRKAWRQKMRGCHPDLSTDPRRKEAAEREARAINEAFQVIKAAVGA